MSIVGMLSPASEHAPTQAPQTITLRVEGNQNEAVAVTLCAVDGLEFWSTRFLSMAQKQGSPLDQSSSSNT